MQSDKCNLRQHCDATTNRMAKSGILTTVNAQKDIKQSELSYHYLVPLGIYRKELKIHVQTSSLTKMA